MKTLQPRNKSPYCGDEEEISSSDFFKEEIQETRDFVSALLDKIKDEKEWSVREKVIAPCSSSRRF